MPYTVAYPGLAALASGLNDHPASPIAAGDPLNHEHVVQATVQHKKRKAAYEMHLATQEEVVQSKLRKTQMVMENAAQGAAAPIWALSLQKSFDALATAINHPKTGLNALATTINDPDTGLAALATRIHHPETGLVALATTINHPKTGLNALAATINHPKTGLNATINHPKTGLNALAATINHPKTGLNALAATINHPKTGLASIYRLTARSSNHIAHASTIPLSVIPDHQGVFPGDDVWFPATYEAMDEATPDQMDTFIDFYGLQDGGVITEPEKMDRIRKFLRNVA